MQNSQIYGNDAALGGGLLLGYAIVSDSVVRDNTATVGGGIHLGEGWVFRAEILENYGVNAGGGLATGDGFSGAVVEIDQNTLIQGNETSWKGGGIANRGTLFVNGTRILDNIAGTSSGLGGGIYNMGEVHVSLSQVRANLAGDKGGFLHSEDDPSDPLVPLVTLHEAKVWRNEASYGGALYIDEHQADIDQSSLFDNEAWHQGGAIYMHGGSLFAENTTFRENWAWWGWGGGAILANTSGEQDPSLFLHHVTMADNLAGLPQQANGVRLGFGVMTVKGNIIDDPCPGVGGTITSLGYNTVTTCVTPGPNDQLVGSAMLLPPAGSLEYYPLDPASPALGFANACPAEDQIRNPRTGDGCDSGSIEQ